MTSFRIFVNTVLVMALVFVVGITLGPRLQRRLPLPLAIPNGSVDEFVTTDETVVSWIEPDHQSLHGVDLSGRLHRLGESYECRAIVLIFLGTECPIANSILPRLNQLAAGCGGQQVEFFGVLSSPSLSHRAAVEHAREFSIEFPLLFDGTGELREQLGATHSPQAFVLTPEGRVLYRGAIDDQFVSVAGRRRSEPREQWLRAAITAVLKHEPIARPETEPVGCLLQPFPREPAPTFTREIAPLVMTRCANCHQVGSVAPFPLRTLEDMQRHAAQIRTLVESRQMPPWRPVRGFGHFRNDLALTDYEIATFLRWLDAGLPDGDDAQQWQVAEWVALPQMASQSLSSSEGAVWQLGEPDLVLSVPEPFVVPADGPDIYQYFVLPTGLDEDRLIAAIEYRSSNLRVVHHASFRFDDGGLARRLDAEQPGPGYQRFGGWGFETGGTLGGWAFGLSPQRFPKGLGRPIRAGSDFVLQTHYHPTGKRETEQAQIGIHFAAPTAKRRIGELIVADQRLLIPANERRFVHRTAYELPLAVTAYSVLPHTHLLGREIKAVATLPDGTSEPLIGIDDWRFNWQNQYFFKQPRHWPAGTRIEFEVIFDNSADNPLNPSVVPQAVRWGEESTQEMAVLFIDVSAQNDEQLERLIAHNRAVQSAQPARSERR